MVSKYKDDSVLPEPSREGVGAVQDSQNEPDAASANLSAAQHAKPIFGRRPTTRRVSEICRLEWQDNDDCDLTGLMRDSLLPHDAAARHRRFKMTKDAWAIIERQPRSSEHIFPYKTKSIGIAFKRACTAVGTPDMTFDHLKREA